MPQKQRIPTKLKQLVHAPNVGGELLRSLQRHYLSAKNTRDREHNIAMLHAGRCGSTVISHLLAQRPDFAWKYEPLETMPRYAEALPSSRRAKHILQNAMVRNATQYWGCDLKYLPEQHLRKDRADMSAAALVQLLQQIGFTHFVLLNRENHLRRAVSIMVGTKTKQWVNKNNSQLVRIEMPIDEMLSYGTKMSLLDFFRHLDTEYQRVKTLLAGLNVLELSYESDVENSPLNAYEKVCGFLKLADYPVEAQLRKMNPYAVSDIITNFSEVEELLRPTRYAWMLES